MIKFTGSNDVNLEICEAAYRALPMYLNRQFIKILEDLGVTPESFIKHQNRAVQELAAVTRHPVSAARFLDRNQSGTGAKLSSLIRSLHYAGFDFHDDPFLLQCVKLTVRIQLRQIKHKGRIPIPEAATLYGTVDETGRLKEGEVYVAMRDTSGKKIIREGIAAITRAPALHPGDVQMVRCIHVSTGPLIHLHNCIVFSQHGARDLASMLSGGDLDGDKFNIIFDPTLWPKRTYQPADYPRLDPIDIGRTVEASDMADFFLKFMETDVLGYICNTHMQVADQKDDGTISNECVILAGMASTAVDYSKTGIPVSQEESRFLQISYID